MKVRVLTSIAGPDFALAPGAIAEIEDDEAGRWVRAGFAEPVEGPVEAAPPAAAAAARGTPRRRK